MELLHYCFNMWALPVMLLCGRYDRYIIQPPLRALGISSAIIHEEHQIVALKWHAIFDDSLHDRWLDSHDFTGLIARSVPDHRSSF